MLPFNQENENQISGNANSISEKFRQISSNKPQPETTGEFAKRNVGQHAARSLETIGGFAGNLKKAFQESREMLEEYLFPGESTFQEQEQKILGPRNVGSVKDIIFNPPTSSELRQKVTPYVAKKLGQKRNYLEPQGSIEEAAGELNQDITSFFLPGTAQLRLVTRLGAPIVGNLAKQGAKYLGASDENADKAKLGFMLATTLAGQSQPGQFSSNRIAQGKAMIPNNATVDALPLANRLMPLYNQVTRGLGVPSKSRVIQGMQDLAGQVQNGRMSFRSLLDARDNVNEWISEAGGWDIPANTRDATIRNLNELKTQIIRTINENMEARFPQAAELYRSGYEAAAVNHQSNAISNFIQKYFGRKINSVAAKLLFPSLVGGAAILPKTAAAGAAVFPFYKTGQVLYRVAQSPTLARYYHDVINHSLQGNAPAMIKSMEKFDKAMAKDEEKIKKLQKPSLEDFKSKFKKKDLSNRPPFLANKSNTE